MRGSTSSTRPTNHKANFGGSLLGAWAVQVLRSCAHQQGADRRGGSRIDALFAMEREINGLTPQQRHERSRPLVIALEAWLREPRGGLQEPPGSRCRSW